MKTVHTWYANFEVCRSGGGGAAAVVANIPLSAAAGGPGRQTGRVTALLTRKEIVSIVSEWPAGLGACVMGTRSVVWPRQAGVHGVCVLVSSHSWDQWRVSIVENTHKWRRKNKVA